MFTMFFTTSTLIFQAATSYKKQSYMSRHASKSTLPVSEPIYQLSALDDEITLVSYTPFPKLLNSPLVAELIIDNRGEVARIHVIRPSTKKESIQQQLDMVKSWKFSVGTFQNKPVFYRVYWAG